MALPHELEKKWFNKNISAEGLIFFIVYYSLILQLHWNIFNCIETSSSVLYSKNFVFVKHFTRTFHVKRNFDHSFWFTILSPMSVKTISETT